MTDARQADDGQVPVKKRTHYVRTIPGAEWREMQDRRELVEDKLLAFREEAMADIRKTHPGAAYLRTERGWEIATDNVVLRCIATFTP